MTYRDRVRQEYHRIIKCVRNDQCPRCEGELDTGWQCNKCGLDCAPLQQIIKDEDAK